MRMGAGSHVGVFLNSFFHRNQRKDLFPLFLMAFFLVHFTSLHFTSHHFTSLRTSLHYLSCGCGGGGAKQD